MSKGGKQEGKDTWWWNDEVQRAIKEKECFKRLCTASFSSLIQVKQDSMVMPSYAARIRIRVSVSDRYGYVDTPFFQKIRYADTFYFFFSK